jgi:hypothetical protein
MNTSVIHNMVSEPLFRVSVTFFSSPQFLALRSRFCSSSWTRTAPARNESAAATKFLFVRTHHRASLPPFFVWVTSTSVSAPRLDGIAAGPVVPAAAPPGSVELPPALQIGSGCSRRCCWLLSTPAPVDAASSAQVGSGRPDRCETCRRHYWTHAAAGLETVTGSILILARLDLFFWLGSAS